MSALKRVDDNTPIDGPPVAEAPEGPPRGVRTMAIVRWVLVVVTAVVATGTILHFAGGRLGEKHAAALERVRHLDRERALARPLLPLRPRARERAAGKERALDTLDEAHQNVLTSCRWMRPSLNPRPGARP